MDRKIGGFDIGIKHLAFCVLTKSKENKLIDIGEWTNINLMEGEEHKCDGILKNKKKCTAKPKFYHTNDDETKYYCGSHKTQHLEVKCSEIVKCKTTEKCTFANDIQCIKKGTCSIDDNIYCKQHGDKLFKQTNKNNSLQSITKTNCLKTDPQVLCSCIFNELNKYDSFKTLNEVRIENQPGLKCPTMKAVASTVFAYFVFLNITYNLNITIRYVSPATKIQYSIELLEFINNKINEHNKDKKANCKCNTCKLNIELKKNIDDFEIDYNKYKFSYDVFKLLSVFYTEKLLIDNNLSHKYDLLSLIKKKDDPCDAFLHANKDFKK